MMGPLVSKEQFDKVKGYLELGKKEGARVTTGGAAAPGKGYFVQPTVFADVNNKMRIAREEIFGPVAATIPFKDENDAVIQGNDTDYGLASRGMDQRRRPRAQGRARAQGRYGMGQLLRHDRSDLAVRRLQAVGLRA